MRAILKEEVNTQLPQILPQAVLDFATPVIDKNVIESLEFVLTIKWELYDALSNLIKTDKGSIDTMVEVFTLKRSRYDKDKDQDPSAGSDRGTKRRKSSKEAESSRDSRSKEKKFSSTSKDASHSQHKPLVSCTMKRSKVYTVMTHKEVSKADWFKKLGRPPTPDPD
ncbi:hypothetical protein Tco_0493662 [Tanacetum coccineum]